MSTERVIVQRSVVDEFRHIFSRVTNMMFNPVQTLVSEAAANKNRKLVADAVSKGATTSSSLQSLYSAASMPTTIVDGVTREMDLYRVESFGPTTSILVVENDEEAVTVANDSEFGLSSAIFTGNFLRGLKLAKRLEAGFVLFLFFHSKLVLY